MREVFARQIYGESWREWIGPVSVATLHRFRERARHLDVIFDYIDGSKRGFCKEQSVAQIRASLPKPLSDPTFRNPETVRILMLS